MDQIETEEIIPGFQFTPCVRVQRKTDGVFF